MDYQLLMLGIISHQIFLERRQINYLVRVEVFSWSRYDFGHERAELNVLVLTEHMNCIFARFCGPVPHITGAISLIVTFDLSRGWALH